MKVTISFMYCFGFIENLLYSFNLIGLLELECSSIQERLSCLRAIGYHHHKKDCEIEEKVDLVYTTVSYKPIIFAFSKKLCIQSQAM